MWDDPQRLDLAAMTFTLIAVALLGYGLVSWLVRQPVFAWRDIVVTSRPERVRAIDIEGIVRDELSGTFFTMQLDRSRAALARLPWVRRVALRRQWPRRLEIDIEEHVPIARWNDSALVNTEGEVFAADYDGDLPLFSGPEGSTHVVAARYREWGSQLAALGLALRAIDLSPRGGWRLTTTRNGAGLAIELGRDDPQGRLDRFVAAYGRTIGTLVKGGTRVEQVDLRYRNGFAARLPGYVERSARKGGEPAMKKAGESAAKKASESAAKKR